MAVVEEAPRSQMMLDTHEPLVITLMPAIFCVVASSNRFITDACTALAPLIAKYGPSVKWTT
jgi:hypothetical protein